MGKVTSLAEVWIEILHLKKRPLQAAVTSLAEVWIEILHHPYAIALHRVTSLAEVWIEMSIRLSGDARWRGHFPCGSVD